MLSTRTVPAAPAPDRGLRMTGKPIRLTKSITWSALSAAVEAAVRTPACRSASFIAGLSRQSHAVRTEVPGIPAHSRICAVDMMCASTVASIRSTHSFD